MTELEEEMTELEECKAQNRTLVLEREDLKRRMDFILSNIKDGAILSFAKDKLSELKNHSKSLDKLDKSILTNISKYDTLDDFYASESTKFHEYKFRLEEKIAVLANKLANSNSSSLVNEDSEPPPSSSHEEPNFNDRPLSNFNIYRSTNITPISLGKFEGDEQDKLAFSKFFSRFKSVIDSNLGLTQEEKLIHLVNCLGGSAYELIRHLSDDGSNYPIALDILKKEYLDQNFMIQRIMVRLHEIPPPPAHDLPAQKAFLNEVRALVYDLKSYGQNCLCPDTTGFRFLSTIIVHKLPGHFKNSLIDLVGSNFPTIIDFFDRAPILFQRMEITQTPLSQLNHDDENNDSKTKINKHKNNFQNNKFANNNNNCSKSNTRPFIDSQNENEQHLNFSKSKATLENFQITQNGSKNSLDRTARQPIPCKFCSRAGHSMNKCPTYPDTASRIERCKVLQLCRFCTSTRHDSNDCPGNKGDFLHYACMYCSKHSHISALCENKS